MLQSRPVEAAMMHHLSATEVSLSLSIFSRASFGPSAAVWFVYFFFSFQCSLGLELLQSTVSVLVRKRTDASCKLHGGGVC